MGIPGLLPFVRKACYEGNVSELAGKTVVVDASCFLHKGLFGCATKVALGQDTHFYIGYVGKYVNFLLAQKCHVILVFDGRALPAKKGCNDSRREVRKSYQQQGIELMSQGLTTEAWKAFSRGTELTREVVQKTIHAFQRMEKVDILVAPYEADAQIAYLMQNGLAHAVVTEDSDLIVFGCEKIIFKMNSSNGSCLVYDRQKLPNCLCAPLRRRFQFCTFRRICILAGCDYLQGGLQGVGLKSAEEIFAKANQPDLKVILPRLPLYLNKRLRMKMDRNFIDDFIKAENTFLYQIVFDPVNKRQVPLNSYLGRENDEDNQENLAPTTEHCSKYSFAGKIISPQKAIRLALGNSEDCLHLPMLEDEFALPVRTEPWSIWNEEYKNVAQREMQAREKRLDDYFGAFKPSKSPVKRHAATPISLSKSLSLLSEEDVFEEPLESTVKRKRLSEVQIVSKTAQNGVYTKWTCDDWLRAYGLEEGAAIAANIEESADGNEKEGQNEEEVGWAGDEGANS